MKNNVGEDTNSSQQKSAEPITNVPFSAFEKEYSLKPIPPDLRDFWRYGTFNKVQSVCFSTVFETDQNCVVAAPTGCGKTAIFEMAIIRERYLDWSKRFMRYGLRCAQVTGDLKSTTAGMREIAGADLIITTPEKWDALTRCWRQNVFLLGLGALLLIDEVHLLNDERGGALEAVVSRMKTLSKAPLVSEHDLPIKHMRIIALSATLPNVEDIGDWLDCPKSCVFNFSKEYRPVPLTVHVLGYQESKNQFLFDRALDNRVGEVIDEYSSGKPSLVFCSSKKSTESLAVKLVQEFPDILYDEGRSVLAMESQKAESELLKQALIKGFAFHHAGISIPDRQLVERLFLDGHIYILCCTTTLALGVNLPAHLVVIKGTTLWKGTKTGYEEMAQSSILQMIGRAGRPGFDTSGVAVIMTSKGQKRTLESISLRQEKVESQLSSYLTEAMNAEVCQDVITDITQAISWIKSTFFYIRSKRAPVQYKLPSNLCSVEYERYIQKTLIMHTLKKLEQTGFISFDNDGFSVSPLLPGKIMSKYLLRVQTVQEMIKLPADLTVEKMVLYISQCEELWTHLRRTEKKKLNEALKLIKFKHGIKKVQTSQQKCNVLLQAWIGETDLQDFSLRQEQNKLIDNVIRILLACIEFFQHKDWGGAMLITLLVKKSIESQCWITNSVRGTMKQIHGIGPALSSRLEEAGIKSFGDILQNPAVIQLCMGKKTNLAQQIQQFARSILLQSLEMSIQYCLDPASSSYGIVINLHKMQSVIENMPSNRQASSNNDTLNKPTVKYDLVVYATQQGVEEESIMMVFKRDIKDESRISVQKDMVDKVFEATRLCPEKRFCCFFLLVSNIVGLDRKIIHNFDPSGSFDKEKLSGLKNKLKDSCMFPSSPERNGEEHQLFIESLMYGRKAKSNSSKEKKNKVISRNNNYNNKNNSNNKEDYGDRDSTTKHLPKKQRSSETKDDITRMSPVIKKPPTSLHSTGTSSKGTGSLIAVSTSSEEKRKPAYLHQSKGQRDNKITKYMKSTRIEEERSSNKCSLRSKNTLHMTATMKKRPNTTFPLAGSGSQLKPNIGTAVKQVDEEKGPANNSLQQKEELLKNNSLTTPHNNSKVSLLLQTDLANKEESAVSSSSLMAASHDEPQTVCYPSSSVESNFFQKTTSAIPSTEHALLRRKAEEFSKYIGVSLLTTENCDTAAKLHELTPLLQRHQLKKNRGREAAAAAMMYHLQNKQKKVVANRTERSSNNDESLALCPPAIFTHDSSRSDRCPSAGIQEEQQHCSMKKYNTSDDLEFQRTPKKRSPSNNASKADMIDNFFRSFRFCDQQQGGNNHHDSTGRNGNQSRINTKKRTRRDLLPSVAAATVIPTPPSQILHISSIQQHQQRNTKQREFLVCHDEAPGKKHSFDECIKNEEKFAEESLGKGVFFPKEKLPVTRRIAHSEISFNCCLPFNNSSVSSTSQRFSLDKNDDDHHWDDVIGEDEYGGGRSSNTPTHHHHATTTKKRMPVVEQQQQKEMAQNAYLPCATTNSNNDGDYNCAAISSPPPLSRSSSIREGKTMDLPSQKNTTLFFENCFF